MRRQHQRRPDAGDDPAAPRSQGAQRARNIPRTRALGCRLPCNAPGGPPEARRSPPSPPAVPRAKAAPPSPAGRPEVEAKVRGVPGVSGVKLDLVFDPPWTKNLMSEAAKLELGIEDVIPVARISYR